MASKDVTMRMKKNVLSWLGHVVLMSDKRMTQKIYDGKINVKRGRRRPRLTFENGVSKVLKKSHVKGMRISRRACMKRLMTVDEAKKIFRNRSVWRSILSDYR